MAPQDLLAQVKEACKTRDLIRPKETVVVAVSGGPDSVALLHLLKTLAPEWDLRLIAAHLNHRFRGAESDAEELLVRKLAEEWHVPCETVAVDIPAILKAENGNPQETSRTYRYRFLQETAVRYGASCIALAHHADDQAETVLMRFLRGTGPDGLEGIPWKRQMDGIRLVRPLLSVYKSDLLEYCRSHGLPYAEDSSNRERKYLRNRLRLDVIPELSTINPQLVPNLVRMADIFAAERDFMDREAAIRLKETAEKTGNGYRLDRRAFLACHVALQRRMIKLILSYLCLGEEADFRKIELVREAMSRKGPNLRLDLGNGIRLVREYDTVLVTTDGPSPVPPFAYQAGTCPALIRIPEVQAAIEIRESAEPLASSRHEAVFDLDRVAFPLTIRNRRPGDTIALSGMNGHKKVKDLLIDEKIPPSERDRCLIVEDAEGRILWIAGLRRSSHAQASPETSRFLHMRICENIHYNR